MAEIKRIAAPIGEKYADWMPRSDHSFEYFTIWEASGYVSWPYDGGVADQPEWLRLDFHAFIEVTEYNELIAEYERLENQLVKSLSK